MTWIKNYAITRDICTWWQQTGEACQTTWIEDNEDNIQETEVTKLEVSSQNNQKKSCQ